MTAAGPTDVPEPIRAWLAEHAPGYEDTSGRLATFAPADPDAANEELERARGWERHKSRHGWAGIALPPELGGRGASRYESLVFADEESRYRLPLHVFSATHGMVVPTLLRWGTDRQKQRFVPPTLDGRELWCQLFSEPGAGSDLAGLSTRAVRTSAGWCVTGQKVWTSNAHVARWGYLLARTDPDVPKNEGLSTFVLDMRAAGVSVRPLRQATGGASFNEVFLDDVHIPHEALLGREGNGWTVARSTLMNERLGITSSIVPSDALIALARERGRLGDPDVRRQLVRILAARRVLEHLRHTTLEAARTDEDPGPEGSAAKIVIGEAAAAVAALAQDLLGVDALTYDVWTEYRIGVPGSRIGGGTEEVMRTILAERVLGLPRGPRVDKDVPWSRLARTGRLG